MLPNPTASRRSLGFPTQMFTLHMYPSSELWNTEDPLIKTSWIWKKDIVCSLRWRHIWPLHYTCVETRCTVPQEKSSGSFWSMFNTKKCLFSLLCHQYQKDFLTNSMVLFYSAWLMDVIDLFSNAGNSKCIEQSLCTYTLLWYIDSNVYDPSGSLWTCFNMVAHFTFYMRQHNLILFKIKTESPNLCKVHSLLGLLFPNY